MKTRAFLAVLVITILALASSAMSQEVCSAETVKGTYAITCTGWVPVTLTPGTPPALVPYAGQGICNDEVVGDGFVSLCTVSESYGGKQFVDDFLRSTEAVVNPDCRGSITFQVTGPVTELTSGPFKTQISAVVLDQGKEIRSFNTDKGGVVTCNLRLMSRNTDQQDQTQ